MSNQIVISSGAKVRSLEGVLTGTAGIVNSVPLGGANGVATLDSMGKVPLSQLPASVVTYLGTWNAATNTPTLTNGVGDVGDLYICNVAGTVNFGAGPITFAVGDWVIYSGTEWQKSAGASGTVTSVAVTESGDALTITGSPITTSGTINIGFAGTGSQYIKGDGTLATFPTTIDQAKRLITEVYNSTGATLSKGTVVYINGGQGNLPTVTKAQANADNTSAQTYGVVQSDITNNNNGFVVVIGSLTDIDTQAYAVGTQLYLSGTTAGDWTSTKPSAPIHLVYVGIVVRSHPTQGVVEIRIQNGYELEELHDVAISAPLNNQGIFYNSSNDLWENKSIATALGYTPANDALVVHLAGTETITGAKTFTDNTIFSASPLFDQSANYKVGASLVGTGNYISMAFDKSGTGSGSILSMKLADGTTAKAINLDFLGSPATYTYTFPASSGTIALTSNLSSYVPYTGATTNVDLGSNFLKARTFYSEGSGGGGSYAIKNGTTPSFEDGYTILSSNDYRLNIVSTVSAATKAVYFGFSGVTATRTYTLPDATGTIALTSDIPSLSGYVQGSGTTNYHAKFTGASTIGNSMLTDDGTTLQSIGATRSNLYLRAASSSFYGQLAFTNGSNGSFGGISYNNSGQYMQFETNSSEWMRLYGNGNLRVFSSSATDNGAKFQVEGNTRLSGTLRVNGTDAPVSALDVQVDTDKKVILGAGYPTVSAGTYWGGMLYNGTQFRIESFLGSTPQNIVIASSGGNVGIGTSSPNTLLQVSKTTNVPSLGTAAGGFSIRREDGNVGMFMGYADSGNSWIQVQRTDSATAYNLLLQPVGGNVGIGTSSPDNLLDVYGTGTNTTRIRVRGTTNFALFQAQNDSSSALYMGIDSSTASGFNVGNYSRIIWSGGAYPLVFATNDIERMRIASDGWVTFQGNGNGWTIGQASNLNRIDNTGSTFRCLGTNNGFTAIAASAFNVNSDYRLKEDLQEFNNSIDILNSIKIYDFKWKDKEERNYGVIAHELQEVLPYLVYGEKDGMEKNGEIKTQGVDYSKLVPVLVKAIQELSAKVTALENK